MSIRLPVAFKSLFLCSALVCAGPAIAAGKVLRVTGWDVYADPERKDKTIGYQSFEQKFNAEIDFKPLNNLAQIVAASESSDAYDVFIISNEGIRLLYDKSVVIPLDEEKIPNYYSLHHSLNHTEWGLFDGKVYAVSWAWGPTGLLYDTEAMSEPRSWNVLWDDQYRGKVTLWDDVSLIWTAALALGYRNVYTLDAEQLEAVKQKLFELNRNVHAYYDGEDQEFEYVLKDKAVLLNSWFDPSKRFAKQGRKFKMVIPKEGAVGMFDSYLISTRSKQKELAYQYMDHQISPPIQQQMVRTTGLAPANIETLGELEPAEIKALHLDEADYFNKMLLWDQMPHEDQYNAVLAAVREDLKKVKTGSQ